MILVYLNIYSSITYTHSWFMQCIFAMATALECKPSISVELDELDYESQRKHLVPLFGKDLVSPFGKHLVTVFRKMPCCHHIQVFKISSEWAGQWGWFLRSGNDLVVVIIRSVAWRSRCKYCVNHVTAAPCKRLKLFDSQITQGLSFFVCIENTTAKHARPNGVAI